MKTTFKSLLLVLACLTFLSACQSLPQASLVYASRQTLGINISTPSQTQPEPLNFTVGFGNQDLAYVPVIADGCKVLDADYQRNLPAKTPGDSDNDKSKHLVDCLYARGGTKPNPNRQTAGDRRKLPQQPAIDEDAESANPLVRVADKSDLDNPPAGAENKKEQQTPLARTVAVTPYDLLHKDGNQMKIEDASSVLGTFGSGVRAGNTENTLGKFFSTGVAAQHLAEGFAYKHAAEGYALYIQGLSKCVKDMKGQLPNAADTDVLIICSSGLSMLVKSPPAESAPTANRPTADHVDSEKQNPATTVPPTAFRQPH